MSDLQSIEIGAGGPKRPILYDSAGNAWMPAGDPMPVMVRDVEPRITDFPTFWNRQMPQSGKARDAGGVTFAQLRALSRQTHVRVVLETVKDRQSKVEFAYTLKPKRNERPSETRQRAKDDPRIDQIEQFWEQPDRENEWIDWQRDMLEQVLVCDNLSLLKRGFEFEEARAIFYGETVPRKFDVEVIDGDTIFPLIDDTGRRPLPPSAAYQQWIKGIVIDDFSTDELMYCPRNVTANKVFSAGSPVEQLLFYINMIMRRDVTKLDFYTKGNMPAGFMPLPKGWDLKQIKEFTAWLNNLLSGNQEERSRIVPVPGEVGKIDYAQKEILQDTFDDAWLRLVCFCFSIPVSSLVREQLHSTANNNKQQATEEGEAVLTNWVAKLKTRVIRKWFGWPDIIVMSKQQLELDQEKRSKIYDTAIKNGTMQIDEVREEDGRDPFNLPPGFVSPQGYVLLPTPEQQAAEEQQRADAAEAQAAAIQNQPPAGQPQKEAGAVPFDLRKSGHTDAVLPIIVRLIRSDNEDLQKLVEQFHKQGIELGAEQIAELVGEVSVGIIALDSDSVKKFLETRANKIVSVNKTTADAVLDAIREAANQGVTPEKMADAITQAFDLRVAQADNIARTEVGSALNGGRYLQMLEEGATGSEWVTARDAHVRESHQAIDGEVVGIDGVFGNGLRYPQDPDGPADEVCNCRCIAFPVIDGITKAAKRSRDTHWAASVKAAEPVESRMAKALRTYFAKQRDQILEMAKAIGMAA